MVVVGFHSLLAIWPFSCERAGEVDCRRAEAEGIERAGPCRYVAQMQ